MDIEPADVRSCLGHCTKELGRVASARTHYSAIKGFFQYLVEKPFLSSNPAALVKYAFVNARKGKTPVIVVSGVRKLLLSIPDDINDLDRPPKHTGFRDKALIGLMAYTFVRIGGALSANVGSFRYGDGTMWLDMVEKGAQGLHSLPISGAPRAFLERYIELCSLTDQTVPLFPSANRNGTFISGLYFIYLVA